MFSPAWRLRRDAQFLHEELEKEVFAELRPVSFERLIEDYRFDAVNGREIGIDTERGRAEMVRPSGMVPKRRAEAPERAPLGWRGSNHLLSAKGEDP